MTEELLVEAGLGPTSTSRQRRYYGWVVAWTAFWRAEPHVRRAVQFRRVAPFHRCRPRRLADQSIPGVLDLRVHLQRSVELLRGCYRSERAAPVLVAGAVLLGVGYLLTGLAQNLWQLYVALGLIAGMGMSASFDPCNSTVVRWFLVRRGQALSVSTSGGSFAAVAMPLLMGWLVDKVSWRILYGSMGAVVCVGLLAASRVMVGSPEAKGLRLQDELGPAAPVASLHSHIAAEQPSESPRDFTRAEAMRTPAFWVLAGIFLFTWIVVFLPLVHLSPFARSLGASAGVASTLVSAIGIGGLLGRTMTGGVSDRIGRIPSLGLVLAVQVAAFAVLAVSRNLATVYPAAVVFSFGYGGTTTVFPAIVGDRFGRAHAGAIVGLLFAGAGSLAAVGPFMAAWIYDTTGSYRVAFVLSAIANGIGVMLAFVLYRMSRTATTATPATPAK